jgi:hypothetical protein
MAITAYDLGTIAAVLALALGGVLGCGTGTSDLKPGSGEATGGSGSSGTTSSSGTGSSGGTTEDDSGGDAPIRGVDDDGSAGGDATTAWEGEGEASDSSSRDAMEAAAPTGKQLLVWVPTWVDWPSSLSTVTGSSPRVATMVSPDFYDFNANGNYKSGPPSLDYGDSNPTIADVARQVHAAGMLLVPLVYGGASNLTDGTDRGIQNILSDETVQTSFITAMVSEAQSRQYDGWNLDWEVGPTTTYSRYGAQYISFLAAFEKALHAHGMVLTVDVAQWYIRQCGGDALVDLTQIGQAVDSVIIEDYVTDFGDPVPSCPGPASADCSTFGGLMSLMCDVTPSSAVSIALDAEPGGTSDTCGAVEGTGPILPRALSAISAVGFRSVAVWPDGSPFLDSTGVPGGGTFVSLLGQWLNQ